MKSPEDQNWLDLLYPDSPPLATPATGLRLFDPSPKTGRFRHSASTQPILVRVQATHQPPEPPPTQNSFFMNYLTHLTLSASFAMIGQAFSLAIGSAVFPSLVALVATAVLAALVAFPVANMASYLVSQCYDHHAYQTELLWVMAALSQLLFHSLLTELSSMYVLTLCGIYGLPLLGCAALFGYYQYAEPSAAPSDNPPSTPPKAERIPKRSRRSSMYAALDELWKRDEQSQSVSGVTPT